MNVKVAIVVVAVDADVDAANDEQQQLLAVANDLPDAEQPPDAAVDEQVNVVVADWQMRWQMT